MIQRIKILLYNVMRYFPLKKKKILFFSYYGEQYSGSPKYISEYFKSKNDYGIVWAFTNPEKHGDCKTKKIKYNSLNYYFNLAICGVIITNYRMTEEFKKRKKQKYVQTWHSSLRLKMIEQDAESSLPINYINMAKKDSKQINVLLAGCKKSKEIFEKAFWYNGKILECGTPQCDIFFNNTSYYSDKVKKYYSIANDCKILLYAPTFRKDKNLDVYNINFNKLLKVLQDKFGGSWKVLVRLHPHLVNEVFNIKYKDVIQVTDYDDVQELLCASDILLSDYSAIMFDYIHLKRPCFLYTPDLEQYTKSDRNLYFELNELPYSISQSLDDLIKEIMEFNLIAYETKVNNFLNKIGTFDDGHACERVYMEINEF